MGCKFAIEHLRKTRGNIINMSSEVALIGQSSAASYATTKAGQLGLTRALAIDLASEGVRVNAVCPAGVMTPLMREWASTEFDPGHGTAKRGSYSRHGTDGYDRGNGRSLCLPCF